MLSLVDLSWNESISSQWCSGRSIYDYILGVNINTNFLNILFLIIKAFNLTDFSMSFHSNSNGTVGFATYAFALM